MTDRISTRAGAVALVGKPNVGKSTLLNAVVGQKVSIVSDKPQTTRRRVLGIATTSEWQIVFVDTPGVHRAKHRLGHALNETARRSILDVHQALAVVDVSKPPADEDRRIAEMLSGAGFFDEGRDAVVLCMNKMDRLGADRVEENYQAFLEMFPAQRHMMTSLTRRQNLDLLVGLVVQGLPESEFLFPEDHVTDQPLRALAAELVREKALFLTRQEVPHSLGTVVESWEERGKTTHIGVAVLVERPSQKAIVIGKGGSMLKRIGSEARPEIEELVGGKVFLELFVSVRPGWRDDNRWLRELDYL